MDFKDRLKQARLHKKLSQQELADRTGIHVTNISRYERGGNQPTTQVLTKLAGVLETTTDYLMSGSLEEAAQARITDQELLAQFQRVDQLPASRKAIVKELIEAFLFKTELQQKLAS